MAAGAEDRISCCSTMSDSQLRAGADVVALARRSVFSVAMSYPLRLPHTPSVVDSTGGRNWAGRTNPRVGATHIRRLP